MGVMTATIYIIIVIGEAYSAVMAIHNDVMPRMFLGKCCSARAQCRFFFSQGLPTVQQCALQSLVERFRSPPEQPLLECVFE